MPSGSPYSFFCQPFIHKVGRYVCFVCYSSNTELQRVIENRKRKKTPKKNYPHSSIMLFNTCAIVLVRRRPSESNFPFLPLVSRWALPCLGYFWCYVLLSSECPAPPLALGPLQYVFQGSPLARVATDSLLRCIVLPHRSVQTP